MNIKFDYSTAFAILGGFVAYFLGGIDTLLMAACSFLLLDLLTGIGKGIYTQSLDSGAGKRGILKKVMWLIPVIVAVLLDKLTYFQEAGLSFRSVMLIYLVANEGISIIENLEVIGIKMPDWIYKTLKKIKDKEPK